MYTLFNVSAAGDCWKYCGKRRSCSWWAISHFATILSTLFTSYTCIYRDIQYFDMAFFKVDCYRFIVCGKGFILCADIVIFLLGFKLFPVSDSQVSSDSVFKSRLKAFISIQYTLVFSLVWEQSGNFTTDLRRFKYIFGRPRVSLANGAVLDEPTWINPED